ncbi:hypothetical protein [Romboutsia lituseburensis]|uniref:hypothetical protein n=1 Tax=Romboutsia lituseburensis TaxID=1537 RepID=UPI00215B318E|nr:hypothetical protein [Romboutsia lituseburensis]MCR8747179.1 hypothetical protein [Romboutsia lituseburensis]
MGMHFKLSESIDSGFGKERFAYLDDYMDDLIYKNKEIFNGEVDIFIELDPYGDKLLTFDEIKLLIDASKVIIQKDTLDYLDSINKFENCEVEKEEFIEFANTMIKTCTFALANNKKIVSQGD